MRAVLAGVTSSETGRARAAASALVAGLTGAAWLALAGWSASPHQRYLDHDGLASSGLAPAVLLVVFVGAWTLMLAAMMLPSTHELVATFSVVVRARPDRTRLMARLLAGYVTVWVGVGIVALLADQLLHELVERSAWLDANEWTVGVGVLAAAGLYQFSPVKDRCLTACRSPRIFVFSRWRGRDARREAFELGVAHGRFCVGCCFALMLLMFAVGTGSLGWMLALGAVMTAEKIAPWGRRLVAPLGGVLVLAALATVVAHA